MITLKLSKYSSKCKNIHLSHMNLYQSGMFFSFNQGLDITSVSAIQFSNNPKLRFLSLGWNDLTEFPSGLLDGLDSLAELRLYDTSVTCACDDLWFITHAQEKFISLHGDIICNGGSYAGNT